MNQKVSNRFDCDGVVVVFDGAVFDEDVGAHRVKAVSVERELGKRLPVRAPEATIDERTNTRHRTKSKPSVFAIVRVVDRVLLKDVDKDVDVVAVQLVDVVCFDVKHRTVAQVEVVDRHVGAVLDEDQVRPLVVTGLKRLDPPRITLAVDSASARLRDTTIV